VCCLLFLFPPVLSCQGVEDPSSPLKEVGGEPNQVQPLKPSLSLSAVLVFTTVLLLQELHLLLSHFIYACQMKTSQPPVHRAASSELVCYCGDD